MRTATRASAANLTSWLPPCFFFGFLLALGPASEILYLWSLCIFARHLILFYHYCLPVEHFWELSGYVTINNCCPWDEDMATVYSGALCKTRITWITVLALRLCWPPYYMLRLKISRTWMNVCHNMRCHMHWFLSIKRNEDAIHFERWKIRFWQV